MVFCVSRNRVSALKRVEGLVEPGSCTLPSWQYSMQTKEKRKVSFFFFLFCFSLAIPLSIVKELLDFQVQTES